MAAKIAPAGMLLSKLFWSRAKRNKARHCFQAGQANALSKFQLFVPTLPTGIIGRIILHWPSFRNR